MDRPSAPPRTRLGPGGKAGGGLAVPRWSTSCWLRVKELNRGLDHQLHHAHVWVQRAGGWGPCSSTLVHVMVAADEGVKQRSRPSAPSSTRARPRGHAGGGLAAARGPTSWWLQTKEVSKRLKTFWSSIPYTGTVLMTCWLGEGEGERGGEWGGEGDCRARGLDVKVADDARGKHSFKSILTISSTYADTVQMTRWSGGGGGGKGDGW